MAFEKKYKQIIDNIKEAYFEVDLEGNFTFMNISFTKMSGYSFDEMMRKNYSQFMDEENKMKIFEIFNSVYKSGLPQEYFQFEGIKKGNTKIIIETSIYLNKDTSGKKIGFYGISRDITQRFNLEHKLKQSEEKYRHLFKSSPYAIWIMDLNGVLIDCNATTNILLSKYTREDIIGKNFIEILGMLERPEYFIPFFKSKFESFVQDKRMKALEFKMTRSDGIEKWINMRGSKIKMGDETLIQVLIQDITGKKKADLKLQRSEEELKILNKELEKKVQERTKELRESERILKQQNIELKELDRLKSDFISIAAHDLKTPLISVGGYIDLILLREKGLNEEVKEDLNRVLNNVRRLEGYINRLLDVMKIEAKKVELVKREENIHHIIDACLSDLEFQIGQKELTINLDISENLTLSIDHFRISQAFLNLLSNAVKFTPKNGKLDISIVEEEKSVLFKIKDNGKGLTPEEIQKIFGKFVTIEQGVDGYSTLDKGSGLGLYIAKGLIEAHGGKIWVESRGRDLGSEFNFTLPKQ